MRQFVEHGGAAFRLFHVNTNDYLHFLNETGGVTKIMPLGDTFNQVNIRDLETMYEDLTRGFLYKEWRWGKFGFGEQVCTATQLFALYLNEFLMFITIVLDEDYGSPHNIQEFQLCRK